MNIIYFLSGTKDIKKVKVRLYHNNLDKETSTDIPATIPKSTGN
jgi:hypothetical protein